MKLARCMGCQRRQQSKYTSAYLAWFNIESERIARKLRLCQDCFSEHLLPYVFSDDQVDELHCPSCGISTDSDYHAVYGKIFLPGYDPEEVEIPFCESCWVVFAQWAGTHSETLEDRRRADDSPATHPSGLEVLRSMGIVPRVR